MKITELILETTDLSSLASFYTDVLGLRAEKHAMGFTTQVGATQLTFKKSCSWFPANLPSSFQHSCEPDHIGQDLDTGKD